MSETPARSSAVDATHTVLLVDDDADWRAALKSWLEREHLRVVALARGDWVVSAIELHRPDLVILDVHLPGANGLDVLGTLRSRCPDVPVLVTTAFGGRPLAETVRRLGAHGYLDKPFRLADLMAEIGRLGLLGRGDGTGSKAGHA
jgi:DNA-binding response OmpR family regulator